MDANIKKYIHDQYVGDLILEIKPNSLRKICDNLFETYGIKMSPVEVMRMAKKRDWDAERNITPKNIEQARRKYLIKDREGQREFTTTELVIWYNRMFNSNVGISQITQWATKGGWDLTEVEIQEKTLARLDGRLKQKGQSEEDFVFAESIKRKKSYELAENLARYAYKDLIVAFKANEIPLKQAIEIFKMATEAMNRLSPSITGEGSSQVVQLFKIGGTEIRI